jgi:hypothetical protein
MGWMAEKYGFDSREGRQILSPHQVIRTDFGGVEGTYFAEFNATGK